VKLIVGLGNPGRDYRDTRHNAGFMVVDEIARRHDLTWAMAPGQVPDAFVAKKFGPVGATAGPPARTGQAALPGSGRGATRLAKAAPPTLLAKPLSYMNLSGNVAAALLRYYDVDAADLLIVVDDIDLPFGRLRARATGWAQSFPGCGSGSGAEMRDAISRITCSPSSSLPNASSSTGSSPGRPTPPRCSPRRASSR
jgi:PTH1 family peptidyl-tRNA hydrolase